jgi:hypothetical protein
MTTSQTYILKNAAAGNYAIAAGQWSGPAGGVLGGNYSLSVVFGTATSAQFWAIGPDGTTKLNVGALITANGLTSPSYLPPGAYGITINGGTASVSLSRVPK